MNNYKIGLILIALGAMLFAQKSIGQSATFSQITYIDKWGSRFEKDTTTITLLPGAVKIESAGMTWSEEIETQSKGDGFAKIVTQQGEYNFIFVGEFIQKVYLHPIMGAAIRYENPIRQASVQATRPKQKVRSL